MASCQVVVQSLCLKTSSDRELIIALSIHSIVGIALTINIEYAGILVI